MRKNQFFTLLSHVWNNHRRAHVILSTEVTYLWDKRGAELEDLQTGRG